ncbi:MAG: transcription elongation factor GreA [Candidatus Magasanikbacteria bacterium]|nr:transcription elongation factor GreA [Candidatus Magasanikbacteria bacterium]
MDEPIQYLSAESLAALKQELGNLKDAKIPEIAKRIDEAKQQGDLSENAEYHQAREDMSWAQGRMRELEQIINTAQVITRTVAGLVGIGSQLLVKVNGQKKSYTIVGPQEINPSKGLISNESPLGEAFLGHKKGDQVTVKVPSGEAVYQILEIS